MSRTASLLLSGLVAAAIVAVPVEAPAASAAAKPPHVTKVSPANGSVGAKVAVKGTGFVKVKKVLFGTKAARFTVHSKTSITATAPAHALGRVDIRVVIKGHTSAKAKADRFTYVARPPAVAVTKVTPSTGGSAGGSPVVISGRGFTGDAVVFFGTTPASSVEVDSSTTVTADSPPLAAGTVDVRVKDDKGTSAAVAADHYTYVAAPYTATPVTQATGDDTEEFGPVSCGAPGSCVAAGITDVDNNEGAPVGVLDTLTSGTWKTTHMKLPNDAGSDNPWDTSGPPAVSCGAAGSCVAVDNYQTGTFVTNGVIDTLANGVWTTATAPAPGNANTENPEIILNDVTCLSATSCVAVGSYVDASQFQNPLVETLSGTHWTAAKVTPPSNVDVSDAAGASLLTGITCSSATACAAYGTYVDSDDNTQRWLAALSSGTWHATEAPLPSDDDASEDAQADADFASISCGAPGACAAVSFYVTSKGGTEPLIEMLSGSTWTSKVAPVPSGAATGGTAVSGLVSIDCTSATTCVAVGSYADDHGNSFGLIDSLSGTTWSAQKAPAPSNNATEAIFTPLRSVACPATGSCTAVGDFTDTDDDPGAVIDTLAAGAWTSLDAVTPTTSDPDGASLELRELNCPTQASCVAAGSFDNNHGDKQGLVETHQ